MSEVHSYCSAMDQEQLLDFYDEVFDLEQFLDEKDFFPEELERMLEVGQEGDVMGLLEALLKEQEEQHGEEVNNLGGLEALIWEGAGQAPSQGRGRRGPGP